jgi:hypothetical protein
MSGAYARAADLFRSTQATILNTHKKGGALAPPRKDPPIYFFLSELFVDVAFIVASDFFDAVEVSFAALPVSFDAVIW